jgi:hypothetical protein
MAALMLTVSTAFFVLSNLSVAPFYLLMLVAPRAALTRRAMASLWPVALPALVYVAFVVVILAESRPDVLGLWRSLYVENSLFGTGAVTLLARLYGTHPEFAVLHGWMHLAVGDLFIARWMYLDAVDRTIPAWQIALAALLIGFLGPIGLAVYLLRRLAALRPRFARPASSSED